MLHVSFVVVSARRPLAAIAAALLIAPAADGQAPRITTNGDPSVRIDSIIKLAGEPRQWPNASIVLLLNDAVMRIDASGRGTKTFRQIVQILQPSAVAVAEVRQYKYSPSGERFKLNWVNVRSRNGTVLASKPKEVHEEDILQPNSGLDHPTQRVVRIVLGSVTVGAVVDISYEIEILTPLRENDAIEKWNVTSPDGPSLRSRFILDVPDGVTPGVTERNLDFRGSVVRQSGRAVYTWARKDVPRYRPEPFALDTNSLEMSVVISLPSSWTGVGSWYDSLTSERYSLSAELKRRVHTVVLNARTRTDSLRAVHRWITQDIRNVSIPLGLAGYRPRSPALVLSSGHGDAKDKTNLLVAILRDWRILSYPVLLNQRASAVVLNNPSIKQFNHVIAAIPENGGYTFVDLTLPYTPIGELQLAAQGGFAVVVQPKGQTRTVALPQSVTNSRSVQFRIVAEIAESGRMFGTLEEISSGQGLGTRRALFASATDSARKAALLREIVALLPGARADSMRTSEPKDAYSPLRYTVFFSNARATTSFVATELFAFPFGVLPASARLKSLDQFGARRTPIDASLVLRDGYPANWEVEMKLMLPDTWRVRVPRSVIASNDFGLYSTEYRQAGRVLTIRRREVSGRGMFSSARMPDVLRFLKMAAADEQNRTIVIDKIRAR